MIHGKRKAVTFSYDDGVTQDQRLISIFNKYGLKGTFNLNSEYLGIKGELVREGVRVDHIKPAAADVRSIYEGHEIAGHTMTHPTLPYVTEDKEIIRQVEEDRLRLSELAGDEGVGFAYPGGGLNFDARTADLLRHNTGIHYARTTVSTHGFARQRDLLTFFPTVYHHGEWDKMFALAEQFLALDPQEDSILYIWGHAYEFDIYPERWEQFEELCKTLSNQPDVFYGTNREVLLEE